MDLSENNVSGGQSPQAAANNGVLQWITRTNVFHGYLGDTPADTYLGNDPFGDLSLDTNQNK